MKYIKTVLRSATMADVWPELSGWQITKSVFALVVVGGNSVLKLMSPLAFANAIEGIATFNSTALSTNSTGTNTTVALTEIKAGFPLTDEPTSVNLLLWYSVLFAAISQFVVHVSKYALYDVEQKMPLSYANKVMKKNQLVAYPDLEANSRVFDMSYAIITQKFTIIPEAFFHSIIPALADFVAGNIFIWRTYGSGFGLPFLLYAPIYIISTNLLIYLLSCCELGKGCDPLDSSDRLDQANTDLRTGLDSIGQNPDLIRNNGHELLEFRNFTHYLRSWAKVVQRDQTISKSWDIYDDLPLIVINFIVVGIIVRAPVSAELTELDQLIFLFSYGIGLIPKISLMNKKIREGSRVVKLIDELNSKVLVLPDFNATPINPDNFVLEEKTFSGPLQGNARDIYVLRQLPGDEALETMEEFHNAYLFINQRPPALYYVNPKGKKAVLNIQNPASFNLLTADVAFRDIEEFKEAKAFTDDNPPRPPKPLQAIIPTGRLQDFWNIITANEGHQTVKITYDYVRIDVAQSPITAPVTAPNYSNFDIHFVNVKFQYPGSPLDKWALNGVTFTIPHGKFTAFVGPSESGKTTVLKLILRYYEVTANASSTTEGIFLGGEIKTAQGGKYYCNAGTNIKSIPVATYRAALAYLSQSPQFFRESTLRYNVTYGDRDEERLYHMNHQNLRFLLPAPGPAGVRAAGMALSPAQSIEAVNLGHKREDRPRECATLSGGAQQRVSMARLLCRNSSVFLFDEPTASLDSINETEVLAAASRELKGKTQVMIAHRLSTIAHRADKIIVMEKAKVLDEGETGKVKDDETGRDLSAHEQLLRIRGTKSTDLYARLWQEQTGEAKGRAVGGPPPMPQQPPPRPSQSGRRASGGGAPSASQQQPPGSSSSSSRTWSILPSWASSD